MWCIILGKALIKKVIQCYKDMQSLGVSENKYMIYSMNGDGVHAALSSEDMFQIHSNSNQWHEIHSRSLNWRNRASFPSYIWLLLELILSLTVKIWKYATRTDMKQWKYGYKNMKVWYLGQIVLYKYAHNCRILMAK